MNEKKIKYWFLLSAKKLKVRGKILLINWRSDYKSEISDAREYIYVRDNSDLGNKASSNQFVFICFFFGMHACMYVNNALCMSEDVIIVTIITIIVNKL